MVLSSSDLYVFAWQWMASVSCRYFFLTLYIQVQANCTGTCNIQAGLRYVEQTHISIFFICLFHLFTKKCACSLEEFRVMRLRLPCGWEESVAWRTMAIGARVCNNQPWLAYINIHRDARRKTNSTTWLVFDKKKRVTDSGDEVCWTQKRGAKISMFFGLFFSVFTPPPPPKF